MVRSVRTLLLVSALGLLPTGCSSQPASPPAEAPSGTATPATGHDHGDDHDHDHEGNAHTGTNQHPPAPQISADTPPQDVVSKFLDSLRSGDETIAAFLLTDKAREETAKHDLVVSPPGTPTAQYEVGAIEFTDSQNGAYVTSLWTEPDQQGTDQAYEIIWVMRKQPEGWRIAGMATEIIPGQMPLFLNFEDPQDMLRKREQALATLQQMQQEALAAQQAEQTQQARQASPGQATEQR